MVLFLAWSFFMLEALCAHLSLCHPTPSLSPLSLFSLLSFIHFQEHQQWREASPWTVDWCFHSKTHGIRQFAIRLVQGILVWRFNRFALRSIVVYVGSLFGPRGLLGFAIPRYLSSRHLVVPRLLGFTVSRHLKLDSASHRASSVCCPTASRVHCP